MKRFLLWLVGVVLGVGIFLGAVMGVSYAFTTEGGCPDSTAQFGTEALEPNGWGWQGAPPGRRCCRCRKAR